MEENPRHLLHSSQEASLHSRLLSKTHLFALWVSVPSGRVKSTGPHCPADSAVTTSTLKASCGRWLHKALHIHTCPVHARVCFSPGTGMKGQSSEAAIGARQESGPGSSQPPALYLSYFFIAVTEGTYKRKHLIGSLQF